ncbi:MAG: hypothetical protein IKX84_08585 [Clostridia bacterium]|nr:hypothetical protein [Clostridia bacterium]
MSAKKNGAHAHTYKKQVKEDFFGFNKLPEKWQKPAKIASVAVVAILLIALILDQFDLLHWMGGRLRYYNGKVYGVSTPDNSEGPYTLVAKRGSGKSAKYYAAGSFTEPGEGYTRDDDYVTTTDEYAREYYYRPVEDKGVYLYSVQGVYSDAKERHEFDINTNTSAQDDGSTVFTGEEFEGVNAQGLKYYGIVREPYAESYDTSTPIHKMCLTFVESDPDHCVMVGVFARARSTGSIAANEVLIEAAREFIDLVGKP